ncbi:MAG: hypothetical protein ACI8QZ_000893 [Chlamydiales bacterium]|jgi:hypothetical protein
MTSSQQDPPNESSRQEAESLYARYLYQAEESDGIPFEDYVSQHGEHESELRKLHSGMTAVDTALGNSGPPLEFGYEVLGKLGSDGQGVVHRARDRALDCDVAIKTLTKDDATTSSSRRRFIDEARAMAKIHHENVVRIHAVDEVDGAIRLVMELIEGRTLQEIVEEDGPLSAPETAQIGVDLCHALSALQDADLVHMDVKPGNVIRERGGRTVLLDFGMAHNPDADGKRLGGTPPFMAPEHFGKGEPGPHTDIYGLGATLYWLLSGRFPIQAETIGELREAVLAGQMTPLLDVKADAPPEFAAIIEKAMSQRPGDRYPSTGYFERALRSYLAGTPGASGVPDSTRAGNRWLLPVAALAVAIVGGMAFRESGAVAPPTLNVGSSLMLKTASAPAQPVTGASIVRVGDRLSLKVEAEEPFYLYVFNEDEEGRCFTLYPREEPEQLPPGIEVSLPSGHKTWTVNTPGGTEHIFLIASLTRDPLGDFLRDQVPLASREPSGQRIAQLDSGATSTLRSMTRGIGAEVAATDASATNGLDDNLAEYIKAYQSRVSDNPAIVIEHWSMDHRSDDAYQPE